MAVPVIINEIAQQSGYQILGYERLAGRQAKFLPIPSRLHDSVRNLIAQSYPDGLYGHQAEAIDAGLKGDDICLATSTASGKSLVYYGPASPFYRRELNRYFDTTGVSWWFPVEIEILSDLAMLLYFMKKSAKIGHFSVLRNTFQG